MSQTAKTLARTKAGADVWLYAEVCKDRPQVAVWTKDNHLGFYNIERFAGNTLTVSSLRALFGIGATS